MKFTLAFTKSRVDKYIHISYPLQTNKDALRERLRILPEKPVASSKALLH